eukprot:gene17739-21151_t
MTTKSSTFMQMLLPPLLMVIALAYLAPHIVELQTTLMRVRPMLTLAEFNFKSLEQQNQTTLPSGWSFFGFGDYIANQGLLSIERSGSNYLRVDSNPFTNTVEQGPAGALDHVKFLALTNQVPLPLVHREVVCSFRVRSQSFGVENHPFGSSVNDPNSDIRLAAAAVNSLDFDTDLVADFLLTNNQIYVVYERLPFGRGEIKGHYASFVSAIPVASRVATEFVDLAIAWDREHRLVRWIINDQEVYRISTVGLRISREWMLTDRGGKEELVFPKNIQCGAGTFTLLDAASPCTEMVNNIEGGGSSCVNSQALERGLVQLDPFPYNSPKSGNTEQTFVDTQSLDNHRIFGQGVVLDIESLSVGSRSNTGN